jgi:type II secretion system protein H
MMILPTGKQRSKNRTARAAFTLIELVLVMAILIVVLSVSGASLTKFFKGRSLDAEAKRFVALTRFAQNRAISEGLPVVVWIDEREKKYGSQIAPGFVALDGKTNEFELGRDLEINVTFVAGNAQPQRGREVLLRFRPDGFFDESNPEIVTIREATEETKGESVFIAPNRNRMFYEISTNQIYITRR